MPHNVNCTSFGNAGKCLHQAAPRRIAGPALCLIWLREQGLGVKDPRVMPGCALCTPNPKPALPPSAP